MTWKRTLAAYAAIFAAGALFGSWALWRVNSGGSVTKTGADSGQPTALSAGWETEVRELRAEVAQMSAQDARALAEKYGEALVRATVKNSLNVPKPGTIAPIPGTAFPRAESAREWTLEDVSAGIADGRISVLAEKSFGPGPRGDELDVLAVLPCDGCAVEIVGKWADPPKLASPLWGWERRRFALVGGGPTSAGMGGLVAVGIDGLRIRRTNWGLLGGAIVPSKLDRSVVFALATGRLDFD